MTRRRPESPLSRAGSAPRPPLPRADGRAASLGAHVERSEERTFQGRSAELARLLALLHDRDRLPRVVSVHGPPGIGKTAFAMALARSCEAAGAARAVVIDSRDFWHDMAGLRDAVAARCAARPPAPDGPPLLLVFDTYEEMADVEGRFRDDFARALAGPVLLVLSGRRRAAAFLDSPAWQPFVDELELGGLPREESRRLLGHRGLTEPAAVDRVLAFARGNPLLLGMAAEVGRRGLPGLEDIPLSADVGRALVTRLTRDIPDASLRRLFEAACLVRTFNEELLADMVQADVLHDFERLCELGVVRIVPGGARVHDLVREVVCADLRWRAPARHAGLRERAFRHLRRQVTGRGTSPHVVEELAFLAGQGSAEAGHFAPRGQPDLEVRPAAPDELGVLEELCRAGRTNFGTPGSRRLRELAADLAVAPEWCLVAVARGCGPVAFGYSFPLCGPTLPAAASTRRAYFERLPGEELAEIESAAPDDPPAFLITGTTLLASHPQAEHAIRRATFARRNAYAPRARRSYLLVPRGSPFERSATAMGMRRRLTGVHLDGADEPFDEWVLEYGELGFVGWAEAAMGIADDRPYTARVPFDALVDQVKMALEDLYREPSLAGSPLADLPSAVALGDDAARRLRALLVRTLSDLESEGPSQDREAAALLISYYVRRVGSHEVVAERLGLARTTFYRRLRRGLTLAARRLVMAEAVADRPD
jgi:hypothetical protein